MNIRVPLIALSVFLLIACALVYFVYGPSEFPALISAAVPCTIMVVAIFGVFRGGALVLRSLNKSDSSGKRRLGRSEIIGLHAWLLIVFVYAASCFQATLRGYTGAYPPTIGLPIVLPPVLILLTVLFFVYLPPSFRWLPFIGSLILPYGPLVTLLWLGLAALNIWLPARVYDFLGSSEIGFVEALALAGATIWQCIRCLTATADKDKIASVQANRNEEKSMSD